MQPKPIIFSNDFNENLQATKNHKWTVTKKANEEALQMFNSYIKI